MNIRDKIIYLEKKSHESQTSLSNLILSFKLKRYFSN